jgi:hypothetical protein
VSWVLKIKGLFFGALIASPAVGLWVLHMEPKTAARPEIQPASFGVVVQSPEKITRIPVEIISNGSPPQWVYLSVGNQAVPEPGVTLLVGFTALLLVFRRQRG